MFDSGNEFLSVLNMSFPCYSLAETHLAGIAVHASVLAVIMVSSLLANGLVILLVVKNKSLRTKSVILSLSVVAADMLLSLSYTLPSLVTTIAREWVFTSAGCSAFAFLAHQFLITRWLIMGMLCLDRFFTVRFPFHYRVYNKKVLVVLTLLSWMLPFLMALPVLFGFSQAFLRPNLPTCLPNCKTLQCKLYYVCCLSFAFFIGCILPTILYSWMYLKGREQSRTSLYLGNTAANLAGIVVGGSPRNEVLAYGKERRAIYTFLLLLVTVVFTNISSYISQIVRSISLEIHCQGPIYLYFICTELLLSASTLNALVIMRDRDFRSCLKHLFCCNKLSKTCDSSTLPNQNPGPSLNSNSNACTSSPVAFESDIINNSILNVPTSENGGLEKSEVVKTFDVVKKCPLYVIDNEPSQTHQL